MTPTQAGDLLTPPQGATPSTRHQGGAHRVPFNHDETPQGIGPVHVQYNVLGEPHDPAATEFKCCAMTHIEAQIVLTSDHHHTKKDSW